MDILEKEAKDLQRADLRNFYDANWYVGIFSFSVLSLHAATYHTASVPAKLYSSDILAMDK